MEELRQNKNHQLAAAVAATEVAIAAVVATEVAVATVAATEVAVAAVAEAAAAGRHK